MKSIKDIFPKGLIDQEAINELKKLIESDQKIVGMIWHVRMVIPKKKNRVYDFRKYKAMQSLGISILNRSNTLKNATNDQVYLNDVTDNF